MTEHSTNLRALTDGSEWDKPSNGTCEKLTAAAAHIDAQDAKIKALVEALEGIAQELRDMANALEQTPPTHAPSPSKVSGELAEVADRAALAAAKETT